MTPDATACSTVIHSDVLVPKLEYAEMKNEYATLNLTTTQTVWAVACVVVGQSHIAFS